MATSTRWPPRPVTRPAHSPSATARPSSSRPSSVKKSTTAVRSSTTMPTLSMVIAMLRPPSRRKPLREFGFLGPPAPDKLTRRVEGAPDRELRRPCGGCVCRIHFLLPGISGDWCGLHGFEVRFESVETQVPLAAMLLDPDRGLIEGLLLHREGAPLRMSRARDEPRPLQHFQMLGDRRPAHGERRRDLADGRRSLSKPRKGPTARRVGELVVSARFRR